MDLLELGKLKGAPYTGFKGVRKELKGSKIILKGTFVLPRPSDFQKGYNFWYQTDILKISWFKGARNDFCWFKVVLSVPLFQKNIR